MPDPWRANQYVARAYNLREAAERTETLYTQVTEAAAKVYLARHCSWIWRNLVTKCQSLKD